MTNTAATKPAAPAINQLDWHAKATPQGEPCDVCGCFSARKGATHRGLKAGEWRPAGSGAVYVVRKSVCFGTDTAETFVTH